MVGDGAQGERWNRGGRWRGIKMEEVEMNYRGTKKTKKIHRLRGKKRKMPKVGDSLGSFQPCAEWKKMTDSLRDIWRGGGDEPRCIPQPQTTP